MNWWIQLQRVLKSGFVNFWRMPVVTMASIITLTATLFVIGSLIIGLAFLNASLDDIKNKVDISVSFKPDIPEERVLAVRDSLSRLPEVEKVVYSSRADELNDFRARNENNELIISSLNEVGNPFGARLNIVAVDPARYESIVQFLETDTALSLAGQTIVDQISFKKNVVDRLVQVIDAAETVGMVITLVLVFISIVVTFNTVSLAIYISREEISLMKLVGAGDNYVRGPFIVEGALAGVIAAFVSLGLLYPGLLWVRDLTTNIYGGINLLDYFIGNFATIFIILLLVGVGLGVVASFLAVRQHLKI